MIMHSGLAIEKLTDTSFGAWTCKGGEKSGTTCDPRAANACGADSICGSEPKESLACIGFGPSGSSINPAQFGLGTALQASVRVPAIAGVYREVPIRGIVYWNLHAFNLDTNAHLQHARLNLLFTDDLVMKEEHRSINGQNFAGIAPFTQKDACGTWEIPKGARLLRMTSHTHRHGQRFWVDDPSGQKIYESFHYADPTYLVFDPPRLFDQNDAKERTFRFCATFNNGLQADGTPDVEFVTRRSRVPSYAFSACDAIACVAGKVGASCGGLLAGLFGDPNRACDTSQGANDGVCDACAITSGQTTEHEMFTMNPDYAAAAQ